MDSDETKDVKIEDRKEEHVSSSENKTEKEVPRWITVIDLNNGDEDY